MEELIKTDPETDESAVQAEEENSSQAPEAVSKPKKKKKRTAKYYAISFLIKIAVTVLIVWVLLTFFFGVHVCHTNSAFPTIRDGEFVLTSRIADPEQGSMIVYRHGDEVKFGRVIAAGGEKVNIVNSFITVNDYGISENVVYPTPTEGSAISFPYTVPDKCVFVLNDYRSDLSDSRTYGGIPLDDVEGVVIFTMRTRGI